MNEKIAKNVIDFLDVAANYYGKSAAEGFSQAMWGQFLGDGSVAVESPIEQLLYVAAHVVAKVNAIDINPDPFVSGGGVWEAGYGLHFLPQQKIGQYRVDFLCSDHIRGRKDAQWVIECDGHDFHERTKAERAYEKGRDRYLTIHGYKILHFTGSEIVADPFSVAAEVLKAVTGDGEIITPAEYWAKP